MAIESRSGCFFITEDIHRSYSLMRIVLVSVQPILARYICSLGLKRKGQRDAENHFIETPLAAGVATIDS